MSARSKAVAQKNHFSNLEFIMSLNKYIPSLVLQQLIQRDQAADKSAKLPELQPMETVVIFADISGFTNLGEACAEKGPRGNEELAFCINRYMEGMVTNLNQYGGDIIKFVGDAMIVMWPPINRQLANWAETRNDTIRRAIQCGQDIQKHMNNLQMLPGVTLSVKIGIGYGTCALLYVGGVFGRSESFTIGEALIWALKSEGQATGGGQIIVAEPCFMHVKEFFKAKELVDKDTGDKFHLVDYKHSGQRVKVMAEAMKIRQQFSVEVFAQIQQKMQGCVAHSIIPYLQIDQERYGSENRSLTVMFVSLGVELGSASTPEGMNKIQLIVTEVQKQVYRLQGSVNKLLMDDKGSTLICLWGLLPFAHDDDAARAILAGFNMIKALNKIDGTYCNIGISSGECFSGVVGTSGSRKEFSVLGDMVNLAARIMGTVKGSKAKNEIRTDLNTRLLAGNYFDFSYTQHYELKGKSISMPFYKPSNPYEKYELSSSKVVPPEQILNVHVNPLHLQRNTEANIKVKTTSFSEILASMVEDITYYFSENSQSDWPYMAVIKGEIGSGKTTFARNLIDELQSADQFQPYLRANKGKLPIFASAVNAETQLQFLNAWKPIIQMLFISFCKRTGLKKEVFLADVLCSSNCLDKVDLLCELTGVDKYTMTQKRGAAFAQQVRETEQVEPIPSPNSFVQRPDYLKQQKDDLIELLTQMIKCFIGEENEISEWNSIMDTTKNKMSRGDIDDSFLDKPPYMIFIDNAHNMCPTSWLLLQNVLEESYRLVVVLLVQSDDMDRMRIDSQSVSTFESVYDEIVERLDVVEKDLPRLTSEQLSDIIKSYSQKYKLSYKKEMDDMTKIIDYNDTIKDDEMGARQRALLTKKWQLQYQMNHVDPEILRVIVTKCRGNPLLCFQYFINLLHNDFVQVQPDGYVLPTAKFDHCVQINDWTAVPVPRLALKINNQMLDQFYHSIQSKGPKALRPGELQACTTAIVLLKAASVLGEEFELKALKHISPLPKSASNSKRVEEAIRLLEQRDFIEIVDETDQKNCVCRFNKCFLRESVYQVLIYKSCKKDLHSATEKYIKQSPALTSKQDNSILTEQLLQHMLLAQDTVEEKDLLYERRSALVVLRVQNQINQNPRGYVLNDLLYKQGEALNKNVEKRRCTLTQFQLKWYHDDQREFEQDKYMGLVKLPFIYDVVKSKQAHNERPSFMISVTMYQNKKGEEKGKRDIFFSCDTVEMRDKWMIAIDYLKTRAIYDAYAKKNTLANFFAQSNEEENKSGEEHEERDLSNLLYDFGDQLKSNTLGGTAQALKSQAAARNNSGMFTDRKGSIFRQNVGGFESQKVTAHDLLPRLKLLYKVGMVAFTHHLEQKNLKTKAVIAKTSNTGKQAAPDHQQMQFPQQLNWNVLEEIDECMIGQEQFFNTAEKHATQTSSRLGSDYNGGGKDTTSTVHHQNSQHSSENRRSAQRQRSSENIKQREIPSTRRSSSISADHVKKTIQNQNVLPENSLIKELPNESDESDNGQARKNSKVSQNKKGRQSVEVNQADVNHLKRGIGIGSMHNSATKQLSINNYRNSEDSSLTPNSTPPLTGNLITQTINNQRSSQVLSNSNPTQEKEEASNRSDEGFSPPIGTVFIDRENRQTFASSHAGVDEPNKHNQQHPQSDGQSQGSTSNNNQARRSHRKHKSSMQRVASVQDDQNSKLAQISHKPNVSMGGSNFGLQPHVDQFKQSSNNEYSDSQRNLDRSWTGGGLGYGQNNSKDRNRLSGGTEAIIGKDTDKKELSMIHQANQYDSRYQDLIGNSMTLDPLIHVQADRNDESQQDNSISVANSQDSKHQKLISTLSTMIKQQLDHGINQFFSGQKETMDRMAQQQLQLQEQMTLQQQQLLNSSFHSQAIIQQQQAAYPQTSTQINHPQHQIVVGHMQHGHPQGSLPLQHSVSALMPQAQYSAMMTSQGHQPAEFLTPTRHVPKHMVQGMLPGGEYSALQMYQQNSPYYNQHSYSALNNTMGGLSELSQGGITSKRHKHLIDSASHPVQSKHDVSDDDEPVDPMYEEPPSAGHDFNAMKGQQQLMQKQGQQSPTPQYELDLRDFAYHNSQQRPHLQKVQTQGLPVDNFSEDGQMNSANRALHNSKVRGNYLMTAGQTQRSFQVPSQSLGKETQNLLGQLSDADNHTDHEATMGRNRQQHLIQQPTTSAAIAEARTPPVHVGAGSYHTSRQNEMMMQQQNQHQAILTSAGQGDILDSASAMTIKPTYPMATDHFSNMSNTAGSPLLPPDRAQDYGNYHKQPGQFSLKQSQISGYQQPPIKFADQAIVFPPPENWTETQYAMYEEPLSMSQYKSTRLVSKAVAIRDSIDLRANQIMIPRNTEVNVLEIIQQAQVCKIEHNGQIGIFKLQDFVKRDTLKKANSMHMSQADSVDISLQMATDARVSPNKNLRLADQLAKKQTSSRLQAPAAHASQSKKHRSGAPNESNKVTSSQFELKPDSNSRTVSIDVHNSFNPASSQRVTAALAGPISKESSSARDTRHAQSKSTHNAAKNLDRGLVHDVTIEQMSSINGIDEEQHYMSGNQQAQQPPMGHLQQHHNNFFREDPEKSLSKKLRGLTARELATYSKKFLEEDKAEIKQKNLKLVERQKRKAQMARERADNPPSQSRQQR